MYRLVFVLFATGLPSNLFPSSVVVSTSSPGYDDVSIRNVTFEWRTSDWSPCVHREPVIDPYSRVRGRAAGTDDDVARRRRPSTAGVADSCCTCYRTRDVTCVAVVMTSSPAFRRVESVAAPFYCLRKSPLVAPPVGVATCRPCRQDCVTTAWSPWSDTGLCDGVDYEDGGGMVTWCRTRTVLVMPADDGNSCGPLVETERRRREGATGAVSPSVSYRWQMGEWTGCRMSKVRRCR